MTKPTNDTKKLAEIKKTSTDFFQMNKIQTGSLASSNKKDSAVLVKKVSEKVACVFGNDSDDSDVN